MISSTAGALVRRGLQAHANMSTVQETYQVPGWGIALLAVTALMFFTLDAMIEYTFGRVVPALLMVESPQSIVFEPLTSEDPDAPLDSKDEKSGRIEPELLLVKQPLITSSFRTTVQHLQARGGRMARFRGLAIFCVYSACTQWATQLFASIRLIPTLATPVLAHLLCAQLAMAWTHIVISEPSPLPWYKRLPSRKLWLKIAAPTAIFAIANEVAIFLPLHLAITYPGASLVSTSTITNKTVAQGVSVLALFFVLTILVVVPAKVTLTRMHASLLSPDVDSIVPFDRSFGGRHDPEGEKTLGMLDAWRSFDWNSRVRLLKAYFKVAAMATALVVLFTICIAGELVLILGDDIQKVVRSSGASSPRDSFF